MLMASLHASQGECSYPKYERAPVHDDHVVFPECNGGEESATRVALWDQSGKMLCIGPLVPQIKISHGTTPHCRIYRKD